jgi:hypothetical protein
MSPFAILMVVVAVITLVLLFLCAAYAPILGLPVLVGGAVTLAALEWAHDTTYENPGV